MIELVDADIQQMVDEFVAESRDDLVGLWQVVRRIEERSSDPTSLRERTLRVVRTLLEHGLLAGNPPYSLGGFQVWTDQRPDAVVSRIRKEWLELGRTPNIPDIVWFSRPPALSTPTKSSK